MPAIRFDHVMTFTSANSIDDYLAEYVAQGFVIHEQTVRHPPGLRNGFISFGPDYLEFWWIEDAAQFAAASAEQHAFYSGRRPFGIGLVAQDIQALHDEWITQGYAVSPVMSRAPRDAPPDAPPAWSFQDIPRDLLPGCFCFALTYHGGSPDKPTEVRVGPNTIYALSGLTFVATDAKSRAMRWRDLLAIGAPVSTADPGFAVQIGPHLATWMSPETYSATYGQPWVAAAHACGEMALVHLLATDLEQVRMHIEQAGRSVIRHYANGQEALWIEPDVRDGVTFLVQERPAAVWLRERIAHTGERIHLLD
jgi:hypothetical protein